MPISGLDKVVYGVAKWAYDKGAARYSGIQTGKT